MLRSTLLLTIGAVLLTGCTGRGFQPPPPEFTNWKKSGVSQEGVKSAMRACGYINLTGTGDTTPIDQVLTQFYCMKDSGFTLTCAKKAALVNHRCAKAAVNRSLKGRRE
jgi:hypothetical protein